MAQQTFNLPYREEPYQVTATRKFYHPQTKTVSINPTTPNPNLSFELVRKTGEWIYTEGSEVLPYGRTVVEDINLEPEDSYISVAGVDGLREFSEEREWIDGEWTGEVRNVTETINQPVDEIYIQGTAVVTYKTDVKRTEVIPFTTVEYETYDYYVGERVVTQQGVNGVRSFYSAQKYVNGVATGIFGGNEIPEVTTQPVTHRVAIGTKPREITLHTRTTQPINSAWSGIDIPHIELRGVVVISVSVGGYSAEGRWILVEPPSFKDRDSRLSFAPYTAGDVLNNGKSFTTIPKDAPITIVYEPL